jgi:hypothetical protein
MSLFPYKGEEVKKLQVILLYLKNYIGSTEKDGGYTQNEASPCNLVFIVS